MTNFTTTNLTAPPPSLTLAEHHHSSHMLPLTAVLCLVALITIPMISYTFFVAIRSARNPFRRSPAAPTDCKTGELELVCGVKYRKPAEGSNDECPVCLSAFAEGEEIRQLTACNHAFHAPCVEMWLYSHANCPVCRAAVPVQRSRRVLVDRGDDFRQGLPDAASLI